MADEFDDSRLIEAFARYGADVMRAAPAQSVGGVREIALRRSHTRTAAVAAVTALAVGIPATGYALASRDPNRRGQPVDHASSQTASPRQSSAPSRGESSPSDSHSTGRSESPRITITELASTKLNLPSWGSQDSGSACPTSGVRLHQGEPRDPHVAYLTNVAYGDVDHDGGEETVALLRCLIGQASREQAVVFDRDEAGSVIALGQVARTPDSLKNSDGQIMRLYGLEIDPPTGGIGIEVGDAQACCGVIEAMSEHQWRWYTWNGSAFRQTDGPRAFTAVPNEFGVPTVTVTALTLGPLGSGGRTGTTTVTLANPGPGADPGIRLGIMVYDKGASNVTTSVAIATTGATSCAVAGSEEFVCHFPALAAGGSSQITLTLTTTASNGRTLDGAALAGGKIRLAAFPEQPGVRVLSSTSWVDAEIKIAS